MYYKDGKPSNEIILVLAKDILMIWKKVGRALKLEETDLEEIDLDFTGVYEKSYQMLRRWTESQGSDATYEVLARTLLHPTVNRCDLVIRFCITEKGTTVKEVTTGIHHLSVDEDDIMPQSVKPIMILPGKPFHKTYEREKELKILDEMYTSLDTEGCNDDVVMVYITGPPGSGKSQLSRLYGNWYGQRESSNESCSTIVVTLHAETPESLLESYKRLARAMNIKLKDTAKYDEIWQQLNAYALVVKRVLRNSKYYSFKWLFIIDNIVTSNPLREFWLSPGYGWGRGRVLVTTQDSELAPCAHEQTNTLSLSQGMDKEDAISFLCLISELDRDKFTSEVADMLNYYPLSLACAAVFVRDMRKERPAANFSWDNCLSNLKKYHDRLEYSEFTEHNICYPRSMLTAAFCSASRMAESSSVLKSAFEFLSLCTLQPVPLDLLKEAILSSKQQQDLIPDLVKKEIARCSLLIYPQNGARGIEVITMHQVMRTVFVQLRMESCKVAMETVEPGTTIELLDHQRFENFLRIICNYYHRFRSTDYQAISIRILLSPHLQACIDTAQKHADEVFIDASVCLADSLIHTIGGTDYHRVQILELAHEVQKSLGLKTFCACRLLTDLGYTYREAGKLDKVIPVLEEAITVVEQFQGIYIL
ncbi:uncharacterized protein LOC116302684 [Actinia tenebrosa]|uniref:Uncharacterized protein LOC116302684 n=1 Tax=Actinia tenebrosa TaxID=6105 RepID=A0A6P8ILP9_ACTTE|nr:uncharacterized protein LOC116302684 [Actinia tenebrosa]